MKTRTQATGIGFIAILLWGLLALLTTLSGSIPPFQLLAMCFTQTFLLMLAKWLWLGQPLWQFLRQPIAAWALGVTGLFGYHFFYFTALQNAPALEASLIAYLWPLLILLFSALLPHERLHWQVLAGALIALGGCWILLGGPDSGFSAHYLPGYLAAGACALIWSTYSVASRLIRQVPTDALGWVCGLCAVLGWICHFVWETTVWPASATAWIGVLGLGLGPLGLAFFAWDFGVKHGNLPILGLLSYAAPVISTLALWLFGQADMTLSAALACVAIVGGALFGSTGKRAQPS